MNLFHIARSRGIKIGLAGIKLFQLRDLRQGAWNGGYVKAQLPEGHRFRMRPPRKFVCRNSVQDSLGNGRFFAEFIQHWFKQLSHFSVSSIWYSLNGLTFITTRMNIPCSQCVLTSRAMKRRPRLAAKYDSDAAHSTTSAIRT